MKPFTQGFAAIEKEGKWGYIDQAGNVRIPLIFTEAFSFADDYARVKNGAKFGYIDTTPKLVIPSTYDYAEDFLHGYAIVGVISEGALKYGCIDKTGKTLVPPVIDNRDALKASVDKHRAVNAAAKAAVVAPAVAPATAVKESPAPAPAPIPAPPPPEEPGVKFPRGKEPADIRPKLAVLLQRLTGAYPDKLISGLNREHKKWGKSVTEIYRALGYPDGAAFLKAYGFKVENDKGGRPVKRDFEGVIARIAEQYAGKEKPAGLSGIWKSDPFYDVNIVTGLQHYIKRTYGKSTLQYLAEKGIIAPPVI